MATTTFSVAATASKLATKVRAWLGGQTTPDVAPVMYQLEMTAATSEKYAVVLAAVYTVGPRSLDDDKIPAGTEEPPLRRAKLLAPPDHVSPAWSCPRHVRDLLQRHVSALAAGVSTLEVLAKGYSGFVDEALRRVNLDLLRGNSGGGGGGGLLVYGARVERLAVQVPCDTVSLAVVAEEGAGSPTVYKLHNVVKAQVVLPGRFPGTAFTVSVEVPEQVKVDVACVEAEYHMELHGKTTLRLKLTGNITISS